MARGRKPRPVELTQALGNPGKRALPAPVLIAGRAIELEAPMRLPVEAQTVWNEIVPTLASVGMLDGVDSIALEGLCIFVARAREAQDHIEAHGMIVEVRGKQAVNPMIRIERDSWQAALKIASEYGLTPVSRTRLGLGELKRKTLAHDLLDRLEED